MDESIESIFSKAEISSPVSSKKRKAQPLIMKIEPEIEQDIESEKELDIKRQKKIVSEGLEALLEAVNPSVFQKNSQHKDDLTKFIFKVIWIWISEIQNSSDLGCVKFFNIRESIMDTLNKMIDVESNRIINDSAFMERNFEVSASRYKDEYKEISLIDSGGFGKVYKAEHKLDEMNYAVKKIKIKARKTNKIQNSLQEVKTLAKLNHSNIVAYKQAWIETLESVDEDFQSQSSSEASSDVVSSSSSETNEFEDYNISNNTRSKCNTDINGNSTIIQAPEKILVLYIQMSLCEQNLREWMEQRSSGRRVPFLADIETIATQILRGLNYIHNMNVIHHDINPKNIFISTKSGHIQVQLGDFGMACIMKRVAHSQDFGTALYAAPEQKNKQCDEKSDMYSFGIVLFELLYPMHSEMERSKKVDEVKIQGSPEKRFKRIKKLINGFQTPDQINIWVSIIEKTTRDNSKDRPSAEELLDDIERSNAKKVEELQSENERLKEENHMMNTDSSCLIKPLFSLFRRVLRISLCAHNKEKIGRGG